MKSMVQVRRNYSANDNAPLNTPFFEKLTFRPNPVVAQVFTNTPSTQQDVPVSTTQSSNTWAYIAWVTPIFAAIFGIYAIWKKMPLVNLLWPSLIIGTLLFLTAAMSKRHSRLRNFSGLFMVGAFATAIAAFLSQNNFTLIGMELTLVIASLALFIGWMFKSKPAVLLSGFMCLIYLASSHPELGLMSGLIDQISFLGAGLIPWIILGQVILSQKLKSSITLFVSLIAGYFWFGTLLKAMPIPAILGVSFIIAAAHYSLGKFYHTYSNR